MLVAFRRSDFSASTISEVSQWVVTVVSHGMSQWVTGVKKSQGISQVPNNWGISWYFPRSRFQVTLNLDESSYYPSNPLEIP